MEAIKNDKLIQEVLGKFTGLNCWVAGGYLLSLVTGRKPKDLDVFFENDEDRAIALDRLLQKSNHKAEVIFKNNNTTTVKYGEFNIDIISKIFSSMEDCIGQFDFTVCMIAYNGTRLVKGKKTLSHIARRELVINKLVNPFSTLLRISRYTTYGYMINQYNLLMVGAEVFSGKNIPEVQWGTALIPPSKTSGDNRLDILFSENGKLSEGWSYGF